MKKSLLITSLILAILISTKNSLAATPTPTLPPFTVTPTQTIGDKIKEKIKDTLPVPRTVAFHGEMSQISSSSATLSRGSFSKQIAFTPTTKVVKSPSRSMKLTDLKTGDYAIAMGTIENQGGTITAKRIVVIDRPSPTTRLALLGTITQIDTTSFTLETPSGEYKINVKQAKVKSQTKDGKLTDLELQDKTLVVGTSTTPNSLDAKLIFLLPPPSATPSP